MKTIFFTLVSLLLATQSAFAQYTTSSRPWLLSSSAAARESKRFTLQEWLENKDRRALMDMWLSINTPTPYEFVIGGAVQNYNLDSTTNNITTSNSRNTHFSEVSAYATFMGLSLEHTNNYSEGFNDLTGIFNLRVFGNTVQGSHLTFHYGLRTRTASDKSYRLNQGFPAVTLQLYLMKYFGIQGHYRSFSPVSEPSFGDVTGNEITYGAFIEYGILRIFGDVYIEEQSSTLSGVKTDVKRDGARAGIKLYF